MRYRATGALGLLLVVGIMAAVVFAQDAGYVCRVGADGRATDIRPGRPGKGDLTVLGAVPSGRVVLVSCDRNCGTGCSETACHLFVSEQASILDDLRARALDALALERVATELESDGQDASGARKRLEALAADAKSLRARHAKAKR